MSVRHAPSGDVAVGVREVLARGPALLAAYDLLLPRLSEVADVVAVRGGVAVGRIDRHSDLDLAVILTADQAPAALATADEVIGRLGSVLARYPASHRGLPWLYVYLVEVAATVIKIDISLEFDGTASSEKEAVVWRRPGYEYAPAPAPAAEVDVTMALERCAGWIWYAHTKMTRGELAEAERALSTMRLLVVIPLLRRAHGLPQEDCRWIEDRLPREAVERLRATYPAGLSAPALRGALDGAIDSILCSSALLGDAEASRWTARVDAVMAHVQRDSRPDGVQGDDGGSH